MPISNKMKSKFGHWAYTIKDEAGATRTITVDDFGAIITNSGGALTATLPAPEPQFRGCWVKFFQIVAGDLVITAGTGLIIADNDAAVDTITSGLDNLEIGTAITMLCTGTAWLARFHPSDETTTLAIA